MSPSSLLTLALVAVAAVSVTAVSTGSGPVGPTATNPCERITLAFYPGQAFTGLNEYRVMSAFIVAVATGSGANSTAQSGLFFNPQTRDYFNSNINYRSGAVTGPTRSPYAPAGSPNFITDLNAQANIVDRLARFFGDALGCGQNGATGWNSYVPTTGSSGTGTRFNQYQIHANMNVTGTLFSNFGNIVSQTATNLGVTPSDVATVQGYLATFARNGKDQTNVICTSSGCPCATGFTGPNCDNPNSAASASFSFVALAVAAFVAIVAARR